MTVNDNQTFAASTNTLRSKAVEPEPHEVERTSSIVARLARENTGRDVEIGEIVDALKDRSFGVLMIMFALPNAVIPGISWILGAPIILFGLQIASGRQKAWLPNIMLRRKLSASLFQTIAQRVQKFLVWIEKWLRPRWLFFFNGIGERLLGLYLACLAVVLMAPIPFGNWFPAFGISFISVGIIEKDGVAVTIGIILGLLGAVFIATVVGGLIAGGLSLLGWFTV